MSWLKLLQKSTAKVHRIHISPTIVVSLLKEAKINCFFFLSPVVNAWAREKPSCQAGTHGLRKRVLQRHPRTKTSTQTARVVPGLRCRLTCQSPALPGSEPEFQNSRD